MNWADLGGWNSADRGGLPPGRREVVVVCCPRCASLDVRRYASKQEIAYWSCDGCQHSWKEPVVVGTDSCRKA
jgi:ribosomal protein L37AE/L43A